MVKRSVREDKALLSLRAAVLLLLAVLAGLAGGLLLVAAGKTLPESVMGGFVTAGSSLPLFSWIVGD